MRKHLITASAIVLLAAPAWGHEGHGLAGAHWHATDAFGWLAVAALAALVYWLSGGGK